MELIQENIEIRSDKGFGIQKSVSKTVVKKTLRNPNRDAEKGPREHWLLKLLPDTFAKLGLFMLFCYNFLFF